MVDESVPKTLKEPVALKGKVEVTAEETIARLREIVQPAGKKGTWLRKLNDHQLAEVYHRLKLEQTVYHVAQIAQREWRVNPKSETKSLCRALRDFRKKAVGLLNAHKTSFPRTPEKDAFVDKEEKRGKEIVEEINGMEELAWLIQVQRGRLEVLITREKASIPFKFTDKTVAELRECIDTYLVHAQALGILKVVPKEIDLTLRKEFDGLLQGGMIKDGGVKFVEAAKRFLDEAKKKALIMEQAPDGGWTHKVDN